MAAAAPLRSTIRRGSMAARAVAIACIGVAVAASGSDPRVVTLGTEIADQRVRLIAAKAAQQAAAERAAALSRDAFAEHGAAAHVQARERALAARVRAAQARVASGEARVALVASLLADQRARLGVAQAPVARLLAALEGMARRPAIAAVAAPGSIDDLVHVRATLAAALPVVRARTVAIRRALAESHRLEAGALLAAAALRDARAGLERERAALAHTVAEHASRAEGLGRSALGASDLALAMGERARDIVDRMGEEDEAEARRGDLAALAPPVPRPLRPGAKGPVVGGAYRLPVPGRLVVGFGEISDAGVRARGLTFAVAPGATVVAPAGGIVRYVGRFRDYGTIVIIDHGEGWTSLLTGLAVARVTRGHALAAGERIGVAGAAEEPRVTVELRRGGTPMDIAALIG